MAYNPAYSPAAIQAANPNKRVGELVNDEAMLGRMGLLETIAGGGFMPGQRAQFEADASRQLGLQSATERALLNRRLAATPGTMDTGFGDALSQQFATGQQNALAGYLSNLDQAGLDRQQQALAQLFGSEQASGERRAQQKAAKTAAWSNAVSGITGAAGMYLGKKSSSVDFKKDIKDLDPDKLKQFLDSVNKIDLKQFRYKPGIEDGGASQHTGMLAEQAPSEVLSPDGKSIDMMDLISMLIGSIQTLSKEFDLYKRFASRKTEIDKISKM